MGSHASGMSYIAGSKGKSLKDWIAEHQQKALGEKCLKRFGSDLPFLFKASVIPLTRHRQHLEIDVIVN